MFDLIAAWFAAGLFAAGAWIVVDSLVVPSSDRRRNTAGVTRPRH